MPEEPDQANMIDLLDRTAAGDSRAGEALLPLVYEELRKLAAWYMAKEPSKGAGMTLQPTALVHEAYAKLMQGKEVDWQSKRHFFLAAAIAMRRILCDRARRIAGPKAGGGRKRVALDEVLGNVADSKHDAATDQEPSIDWLTLEAAMHELEAVDPELADVVHLRVYVGLSVEQSASALGIAPRTLDRRWKVAKGWLMDALDRIEHEDDTT
jgi:RNA polymerase sigma factor (TIGR02999 family)